MEIGNQLNDDEKKEATDEDVSTLATNEKYGSVLIESLIKLLKDTILNLALAIYDNFIKCKPEKNTETWEYGFVKLAQGVIENEEQGIYNVGHFLKDNLDLEELDKWRGKYCELDVIKLLIKIELPEKEGQNEQGEVS